MDFNMNYGWVCPVCGKGNAPWASQCSCEGKIPTFMGPTCEDKVTPSTIGTAPFTTTAEDFQAKLRKYTNNWIDSAPWSINSYGEIVRNDDEPADSTSTHN